MISEYTRYNNVIREYKSKKYWDWFHKKYKGMDAHHLLNRRTDFLLFPVRHSEHLQKVHQHKAFYFEKCQTSFLHILLVYVKETFGETVTLQDYEPDLLKHLFEKVQQLEGIK